MAKNKKKYVGASAFKIAPIIPIAIGLAQLGGALVKGGRARAAAIDAEGERDRLESLAEDQLQSYKDFDFRVENPYEDLTVNLQEAEFIRDQQAQQAANTLANLRQTSTGAGAAALATAMSRQGVANARRAAASIAAQERANQLRAASFQASEDRRVSALELQRIQNIGSLYYGQAGAQQALLTAAEQTRDEATGEAIGAGVDALSIFAGGVGGSGVENKQLFATRSNLDFIDPTYGKTNEVKIDENKGFGIINNPFNTGPLFNVNEEED